MASEASNSPRGRSGWSGWSGCWPTEGFRVGGRSTGSAKAGAAVSGSALTTTSPLGETPSPPRPPRPPLPPPADEAGGGDVFASRFLRGRGLVTRSVMSMMTEPCNGPEQRRPSRWHCWHVSGVSSHWMLLVNPRSAYRSLY